MKPAFWDSSSLVPLFVQQHTSAFVRQLARCYSVVVWWGTSVELRSAFARLLRMGELNPDGLRLAENSLAQMRAHWREVRPDDALRSEAERLLTRFPLRAADALQLAAAMTWAMDRPQGRAFLSGDAVLLETAQRLGFEAIEA